MTFNLQHFSPAPLAPHWIIAQHPDAFIDDLFALDGDEAVAAVARMRSRLRAPAMTPEEFIASIEALPMPATVTRLRSNSSRI